MPLNDTFVKKVKPAGKSSGEKHSDGGGMYLHVTETGKYWRLAYRMNGKQKTLALGVYPAVSLAQARARRDKAREQLAEGVDPGLAKREERQTRTGAAANTFRVVALELHAMKAKSCAANTSAKMLTQMENHIFPVIGNRPIADVKPPEILAMLKSVEAKGTPYTAGRLREICGQVFRYAIQTGTAIYDPAASMRGAIAKHTVRHRPALTTRREFGEFLCELRDTVRAEPLTRLCARFGVLTWTRPKELRQARWVQFDIEAAEWRIPAIEMKTGKHLQAHTVPLSQEALDVLPKLRELATRKYVKRAAGDVYVITGPVYVPSVAQSPGIGPGQVRVPRYLFKLVYDQDKNRAWAYWHENSAATRPSKPISYGELVRRVGIELLPGAVPGE